MTDLYASESPEVIADACLTLVNFIHHLSAQTPLSIVYSVHVVCDSCDNFSLPMASFLVNF